MSHADERRTLEERAAIRANRNNPMPVVLGDLPDEVRPNASIVGCWVWIAFPSKPDQSMIEYLIDIGFKWNKRRQTWQHSCGVRSRKSPSDPRYKYGEVPVEAAHQAR